MAKINLSKGSEKWLKITVQIILDIEWQPCILYLRITCGLWTNAALLNQGFCIGPVTGT